MSKVVDWRARAERLANILEAYSGRTAIDTINRETERDEPDAEPVKAAQPAFAAGQWVRDVKTRWAAMVRRASGGLVWLGGPDQWVPACDCARIPDRPSDEWMRDNAPGWRLTGRVEDCAKERRNFVTASAVGGPMRVHVISNCAKRFDGYRWTVDRIAVRAPRVIDESAEVRAELASIRARLDEIAAKVGAA